MRQWLSFIKGIRRYENIIYTAFCIGIVYSLIFWTLLNSILCIALAAYWLLFTPKKKPDIEILNLIIIFISPYIVFLIGLIYTSNMSEGLKGLQLKSALILFPIIFGCSSILTPKLVKLIFTHFVIATTLACCTSMILGAFNAIQTGSLQPLGGQSLFMFRDIYPYIMGLFALFSIILAWRLLPESRPTQKKLIVLTIALLSLFVILLSNRLILGCWLLIILILIFRNYIKSFLYRILTVLAMITAVIIAVIILPSLHSQWRDFRDFSKNNYIQLDQDASLGQSWGGKAIRQAIWRCGKSIVSEHWLLGTGSGDAQDDLQTAYEERKFYFASRYNRYNAHNQYLQMLIAHGIVGLIVFLLCIGYPFLLLKKNIFEPAYYLFIFLFFAISFTESVLEVNKAILWYSFFNSIFAFKT